MLFDGLLYLPQYLLGDFRSRTAKLGYSLNRVVTANVGETAAHVSGVNATTGEYHAKRRIRDKSGIISVRVIKISCQV
jgi:hypothetical protein